MIEGQPVRITERASSRGPRPDAGLLAGRVPGAGICRPAGRIRRRRQCGRQPAGGEGDGAGGGRPLRRRAGGAGRRRQRVRGGAAAGGGPGPAGLHPGPRAAVRRLRPGGAGLVGSRAYVGRLRNEGRAAEIQGMLNLDMMGYDRDDDGAYTIFECGRPEAAFLIDTLDRSHAGAGPGAEGSAASAPAAGITGRSGTPASRPSPSARSSGGPGPTPTPATTCPATARID